ncbi:MAG: carbamoyltransferase HypF [Methylophaga sp.]|nr:MAG: carbamoyltransferase HypF [Methylophaga sp.]
MSELLPRILIIKESITTVNTTHAEHIRVCGNIQGVGFRPTVWRLAQQFELTGCVSNDGNGVLIKVQGSQNDIDDFVQNLVDLKPTLARIDSIDRQSQAIADDLANHFEIVPSIQSTANTGVIADAATCAECISDIFDPNNRRYVYPFTNCTHCGPRLSIIRGIPYDRSQTSMAQFTLCADCEQEYNSPENRRFHAQANACPNCGPECWLADKSGNKLSTSSAIVDTAEYLKANSIVAIKGIGGFHLAVNACNEHAVQRLRDRKQRPCKPFALMAKDMAMIEHYCHVNEQERALLTSSAAPIVLLERKQHRLLANNIAPEQNTLGFMLPYSPLHHLLLSEFDHPIILTSANATHEPQCIENKDALARLASIADYFLLHNRDIENRVDDSVMRIMGGQPQFLRRARGHAPHSIVLPDGFDKAPHILALGGELKNTFCLLKNGYAVLSQHIGDLENYPTYKDYRHNINLYETLFQHQAAFLAVDAHPEYLSTKAGHEIAQQRGIELQSIQHHHAHIASCLADNHYPLGGEAVLGIALDGLGYGDDNTLWGGEFLLADYYQSERLAHFKPIALLGGTIAMKQPWRNTYAHLQTCLGWAWVNKHYADLELVQKLSKKPLATFDAMLVKNMNCPLTSSAGRLFDAVAAAVGICSEQIQYEGQAAIELEANITEKSWSKVNIEQEAYPFSLEEGVLDPSPMWRVLLEDLSKAIDSATISARFHKGLSLTVQQLASQLAKENKVRTIVLSGGVFQNKTLFEDVKQGLEQKQFTVLVHNEVPANDGGIALGQAVIVATRIMRKEQCV